MWEVKVLMMTTELGHKHEFFTPKTLEKNDSFCYVANDCAIQKEDSNGNVGKNEFK